MSDEHGRAAGPFGLALRQWRRDRGVSQLALATQVATTSRHLSFLETGRSRPSRQMVLRLGEALGLSLRERNRLLHAAGLPAAYPEERLTGADLRPFRATIEQVLRAHSPYPAMVVDRHWNVLLANDACSTVYGARAGVNMVRLLYADPAASAASVHNWPQLAWAGVVQLREQFRRTSSDEELRELLDLAEGAVADLPRPDELDHSPVMCPAFTIDGQVVRTMGMALRFDPAIDITLDELRIELLYPLDAETEQFFRSRG